MEPKASVRYVQLNEDVARVEVVTIIDDAQYVNVHVAGPPIDVKDYYEGKITLVELRARWFSPHC